MMRQIADPDGSLTRLAMATYQLSNKKQRSQQARAIMHQPPGTQRDHWLNLLSAWCKLDAGKSCDFQRANGRIVRLARSGDQIQIDLLPVPKMDKQQPPAA